MQRLKSTDPVRLGPIAIHGLLGYGGMGRVYFGLTADKEPVAAKVIREDLLGRTEVRARFFRELDALRAVHSPHIAALLDASDENAEQPWFAIEYIRGLTVKELVETRDQLTDLRRKQNGHLDPMPGVPTALAHHLLAPADRPPDTRTVHHTLTPGAATCRTSLAG